MLNEENKAGIRHRCRKEYDICTQNTRERREKR